MSEMFYYLNEETRHGPVPLSELKVLAAQQKLKRADKIWKEGMASWQSSETVAEIFQGLPPDVEPAPNIFVPPAPPTDETKRSGARSAGGLAALSFFLPGVGQMVCGQTAKGTIFLIVSIILNLLTGGFVSLIICPFAAFDAYQLTKIKNAGARISDWDFMPSPNKPTNLAAFWTMVGLSILFLIVSLVAQDRVAKDQQFDSLMDTIRSASDQ